MPGNEIMEMLTLEREELRHGDALINMARADPEAHDAEALRSCMLRVIGSRFGVETVGQLRKLLLRVHPDHGGDAELAKTWLQPIQNCLEYLRNPDMANIMQFVFAKHDFCKLGAFPNTPRWHLEQEVARQRAAESSSLEEATPPVATEEATPPVVAKDDASTPPDRFFSKPPKGKAPLKRNFSGWTKPARDFSDSEDDEDDEFIPSKSAKTVAPKIHATKSKGSKEAPVPVAYSIDGFVTEFHKRLVKYKQKPRKGFKEGENYKTQTIREYATALRSVFDTATHLDYRLDFNSGLPFYEGDYERMYAKGSAALNRAKKSSHVTAALRLIPKLFPEYQGLSPRPTAAELFVGV